MSSIDLDADPYVPAGWSVEEHRKGGQTLIAKSSRWLPQSAVFGLCGNGIRRHLSTFTRACVSWARLDDCSLGFRHWICFDGISRATLAYRWHPRTGAR
jgi:hypothetical protein